MIERLLPMRIVPMRSVSGLAFALLVGQVLGFARDLVLVAVFGASAATDAFFVAMTIPDLVLQLTLAGATTAAMIPLLSRSDVPRGSEHRQQVVSTLLWFYGVAGAAVAILGWILMPLIVRSLAPGFAPDTAATAVRLGRTVLPVPLFVSLAGVLAGLLNYQERFVLPAIRFSIQSLTIVLATLLLGRRYGIGIAAVAASVGAFLGLVFLVPDARRMQRVGLVSPRFSWRTLQDYLRLALPIVGTAILVQLVLVGEKVAASHFPEGSVASIVLARKLVFFGIAIGTQSLITVIYPQLARAASQLDWRAFRHQLRGAATLIASIMGLAALILWPFADTVIALLLRRGAFLGSDVHRVADLLRYFALGLPLFSLNSLLVQAFNARRDPAPPFLVGLGTTAVYFALLATLPARVGLVGIPMAMIISDGMRMAALWGVSTVRTPESA